MHDDEREVQNASMDVMSQDAIEQYIRQKMMERPGFAKLNQAQMYEMLNLTKNGKLTMASIMNFCIYPQGFFPQLAITAVVVPGLELGNITLDNARFLDNKRIEGTISEMIESALNFCRRNMKIKTVIQADTGRRVDQMEYPMDAIREAVLNALIHRDYSIHTEGTPVQILFFSNRLEIHSPGSLYGRMSVEQLGISRPDLRNPSLAVMTETLTQAENRYSGIPTMRRAMKEYHLPEPQFENRRNEFVVIFYNDTAEKKVVSSQNFAHEGNTKEGILEFCKIPRTRKEIADYLGIKTVFYVMQQYVKPLLEKGKLAMTLPDKPKSSKQQYYTVQ